MKLESRLTVEIELDEAAKLAVEHLRDRFLVPPGSTYESSYYDSQTKQMTIHVKLLMKDQPKEAI